jgi:SAM-dependent methyltransferase
MKREGIKHQQRLASDEKSVSALYQDSAVADKYIKTRLLLTWQQLLHETQVRFLRQSIQLFKPVDVLEIAPGPARLTTELTGISKGTMLEYSREMIDVARTRLQERKLLDIWTIVYGNAFESKDCPGPFDFIYTFRFIRHFDKVERMRLYAAIRSRLKPNGILVFDVVNCVYNKQDQPPSESKSDSLPVFDVGYTVGQFRDEMKTEGFEVLDMLPVIRHYRVQSWISMKLFTRAPVLARWIVQRIENIPSRSPLEWVAVCRKIGGLE